MKKLQSLFIGIIAIIVILFFGVRQLEKASGMAGADTLTIYNWGDYIDPALIKKFEKETGYKVNYETFDSNEAMYTKIQQGVPVFTTFCIINPHRAKCSSDGCY